MASKAKKKKGGWQASDWPNAGKGKVVRGFCQMHRTFWCPCAAPSLYETRSARPAVKNRFANASNTVVLDSSHQQGIERGKRGQEFAARELGAKLATRDNSPYDFITADGTKVDVKTTKHGMPLMIPIAHKYKVDPARVDAFLLVWDGDEPQIVGKVDVMRFRRDRREDGIFPIPTMHMEASTLDPIPESWRA